jgi:hypothetical protein
MPAGVPLKDEKLLECSNLAAPGASFVPPTPFDMLTTGARYLVLGDIPRPRLRRASPPS